MTISIFLALLVSVVFLGLILRAAMAAWRERAWLPGRLASGKLLFSEKLFVGSDDVPIVARIDRGYLVGGQLHLLELKTRTSIQIYESDVIELSAQSLAVESATEMEVDRFGTVVIENPDTLRRSTRSVKLHDRIKIIELLNRRSEILDGVVAPRETGCKSRCATCEYRPECKGKASAKVFAFVRS